MVAASIFSGAGTGLLLGLLLGLSSSPVVGLVVGAVAAVLVAFLERGSGNVTPGSTSNDINPDLLKIAAIRTGTVGLASVVGVFVGIYLRTHDSLSPPAVTAKQRVEELVTIGFNATEARAIVYPQLLKENLIETTSASGSRPGAAHVSARNTLLFSESSIACDQVRPDRFANYNAAVESYRLMNHSSLLRVVSLLDRHIADEKARMELMRAVVEATCK